MCWAERAFRVRRMTVTKIMSQSRNARPFNCWVPARFSEPQHGKAAMREKLVSDRPMLQHSIVVFVFACVLVPVPPWRCVINSPRKPQCFLRARRDDGLQAEGTSRRSRTSHARETRGGFCWCCTVSSYTTLQSTAFSEVLMMRAFGFHGGFGKPVSLQYHL